MADESSRKTAVSVYGPERPDLVATRSRPSGPDADVDRVAEAVIGAAAEVHRTLGPRRREPVYEEALCVELGLRGVPFVRRSWETVEYKGQRLPAGRSDLIVAGSLVVEFDEGDSPRPERIGRVLSRLRATGFRPRLFLDFKAPAVRHGMRRF